MDTKIIDMLAMVRLDISIWSARAKLREDDLKDTSNLPPSAMVSLGSKRLFDPTALRIFNAIKARAFTTLDRNGVKFLGGWATDTAKLGSIATELSALALEFNNAVDDFLNGYDRGIDEWVAQFPEYEQVLRNAVPSLSQLKKKFAFNWQTYKIQPLDMGGAAGDNLNDTLQQLDNTGFEEVARMIEDIYKTSFEGKSTVTKKAFRPFRHLSSKLQALGFIHPYFDSLDTMLTNIINGYMSKCNDPRFVAMFSQLLASLTTADGVRAIVAPFASGSQTEDMVLDACAAPVSLDDVQQPDADDPDDVDENGELLVEVLKDRRVMDEYVYQKEAENNSLDSGGLW